MKLKGAAHVPTDRIRQPVRREWTILCYADTNCAFADEDLDREMASISKEGIDDRFAFVVQRGSFKRRGLTRREIVVPSNADGAPATRVVGRLGKTNMASGRNLRDFLVWGAKRFPADHILVILGGHGGAFMGSMPDAIAGKMMTNGALTRAFNSASREVGRKFDIVAYDGCLMACAEAAHALSTSANYYQASEEIAMGQVTTRGNQTPWAHDYAKLMKYMRDSDNTKPIKIQKMLELLQRSWVAPTVVSTIRCDAIASFEAKVKTFASFLLDTKTPADSIKEAFRGAQHFGIVLSGERGFEIYDEVRDVASLADHVAASSAIADDTLKNAARSLSTFVKNELVVALKVRPHEESLDPRTLDDAHGISIYAPVSGGKTYLPAYKATPFAKKTGWAEVVRRYGMAHRKGRKHDPVMTAARA